MKHHADYGHPAKPDIATLSRILRTTRGLSPEQKAEIRDQIRAEQARQNVPLTPNLAARLVQQPR